MALDTQNTASNLSESAEHGLNALESCGTNLNHLAATQLSTEELCKNLGYHFKSLAFTLGIYVDSTEKSLAYEATQARNLKEVPADITARIQAISIIEPSRPQAEKYISWWTNRLIPNNEQKPVFNSCFSDINGKVRPLPPQVETIKAMATSLNELANRLFKNSTQETLETLPETMAHLYAMIQEPEFKDSFKFNIIEPMCEAIRRSPITRKKVINVQFQPINTPTTPIEIAALQDLTTEKNAA